MYEAEHFFIEKLRKFPFETYIVLNKKEYNLAKKKRIEKYSKKVSALALPQTRKSFCSEISSAVIYYDRELNLVSKCRKMNNLYWGIIIIRS